MEPPSAPPRRGHGPWQGLLLAASLLTLCNAPSSALFSVEAMPQNAAQGTDVLLLALHVPDKALTYHWYRGKRVARRYRIATHFTPTHETTPGPASRGGESVYPNGSLLLPAVSLNDGGFYTLQVINMYLDSAGALGLLRVYEPVPQPSIRASNATVLEQDSVLLTCLPAGSGTSIRWIFNGQSLQLPGRMRLSQDRSALTIAPVSREDAGEYQCEVSNPFSSSSSDVLRLKVPHEPLLAPPDPH